MYLNLINAEMFEFDNFYEWDSHFTSFDIDSSHKIVDVNWFPNENWGYIIVKMDGDN